MKPKIEYPVLNPSSQPELQKLADLVGEFIEYWGFKAVQGRMWCYLYTATRPLSSIELAQLLEISPALVTQSVKVLLDYKVILNAGKGANGILLFEANPNVSQAIAGVLSAREAVLLDQVDTASQRLVKVADAQSKRSARSPRLDSGRVEQIEKWVTLARSLLSMGLNCLERAAER